MRSPESVIDRGLAKHPDAWALVLARATMLHDENNYHQEIERSADFAQAAAGPSPSSAAPPSSTPPTVPGLEQDDETTEVFDFWYYAGLGACDPQAITEETVPTSASRS